MKVSTSRRYASARDLHYCVSLTRPPSSMLCTSDCKSSNLLRVVIACPHDQRSVAICIWRDWGRLSPESYCGMYDSVNVATWSDKRLQLDWFLSHVIETRLNRRGCQTRPASAPTMLTSDSSERARCAHSGALVCSQKHIQAFELA